MKNIYFWIILYHIYRKVKRLEERLDSIVEDEFCFIQSTNQ